MWRDMPLCDDCWMRTVNRGRGGEPLRMMKRFKEQCCNCGEMTESGIYARRDTELVPFPGKYGEED